MDARRTLDSFSLGHELVPSTAVKRTWTMPAMKFTRRFECFRVGSRALTLLAMAGCGGSSTNAPAPPAPCAAEQSPRPRPSEAAAPDAGEGSVNDGGDVDAVARELIKRINDGDGARIEASFGEAMRKALPLEKTSAFIAGVVSSKGKLLSMAREPGGGKYLGTYRFTAERGQWRVELRVDDNANILGLKFSEPPPPEPPVVKSSLPMGLPFRGQWSVLWGGDTLDLNQHAASRSQRRAADLVMVNGDGTTFHGDGKKNEDYLAYGKDVLAVADGTVVSVVDGVPENVPGSPNPLMATGNTVVVQHDNAVYSVFCHLQPHKIRVKVGAKVKRGAVLGSCGNSGNSSEPHLHFQLEDGPSLDSSWGILPFFKDVAVVRGGSASTMAEYTWLKGDLVGSR